MSKYHSSSHTTYNIGYHVVFSPKYRYRLLRGASAAMLKELLLEKASNLGIAIQTMEVMPDHVPLFVVANPNMNIGTSVKILEGLLLVPPQASLRLSSKISEPVDQLILRRIRRTYIGKDRGEVYRISKIKDAFISRLKPGRIPAYYLKNNLLWDTEHG